MLTLKLLKVLRREELGLYISRTIYIENFNKNLMTRRKLILNHCFVRNNFLSNSSYNYHFPENVLCSDCGGVGWGEVGVLEVGVVLS